ncbi:hypothetical protein V8E36_001726 [Tilletia maclaganii]
MSSASLDAQQRGEYYDRGQQQQQQQSGSSSGPSRQTLRLTPKEADALQKIQDSVRVWRSAGFLAGSAAAMYFARRRKPPIGIPITAAVAFLAGWAGVYTATPFGVYAARGSVKEIEDPNHFKRILVESLTNKRFPEVQQGGSQAPQFATDRRPGWDVGSNDADMSQGTSYPSAAASPTPAFNSNEDQEAFPASLGSAAQGSSRWAQIRGDRSTPSSTWDRIRSKQSSQQRNATASDDGRAPGSQSEPYPAFNTASPAASSQSSSSWPSNSDGFNGGSPFASTFPSASSGSSDDAYQRQQSEFDAMLDRERRSAEDNQGIERLGSPFVSDPNSSGRRARW